MGKWLAVVALGAAMAAAAGCESDGNASYQSGSRVHGTLNTVPIATLIDRR